MRLLRPFRARNDMPGIFFVPCNDMRRIFFAPHNDECTRRARMKNQVFRREKRKEIKVMSTDGKNKGN